MKRRFVFSAAAVTLLLLLSLMIWVGSFSFSFGPPDVHETIVLSGVSVLIFILAVTLGFMLLRAGVKAFMDRQQNREGSRIRSRLLLGALALTLAPTLFSAFFNYFVLNRTLNKWFQQPVRGIEMNLQDLDKSYRQEAQSRIEAQANWMGWLPETREAATSGRVDAAFFRKVAEKAGLQQMLLTPEGGVPILLYQRFEKRKGPLLEAKAPVMEDERRLGELSVMAALSLDPADKEAAIGQFMDQQKYLGSNEKFYKDTYFLLICLLTLFVLFFAAWSAQILSRQISVPISALLGAAQEVRRGDLSYRVNVHAIDELATLVRAFNAMTSELEGNASELEVRRQFTEAILESIPTGVISVSLDERIERGNRALQAIFSADKVATARKLADLFSPEELAEIRYVLNRARRTGGAACQLEHEGESGVLHLAVTVASLEEQRGFVMVLEDTSDLLRAQKATAWQEVARRIAHEIKNPLTPISLCADRMARQLKKLALPADARAILEECTQTIQGEVQTVKSLVDEFSQFSRFPAAQPVLSDLNDVVQSAIAVFAGRLDHIDLALDLQPSLSPIMVDREQIKRVIVNLVDNAAEAMQESLVKRLSVVTLQTAADTVELSISDTGCGVSVADREKLFLPYFSTKGRGTGLGLAIVSHILTEHRARVRLEDNRPNGTRFTIEFNTPTTTELDGWTNSDEMRQLA
ncbi:MAG TPA: ATP-binding protein [Bryobacteraceae bacterium]|nr:ATP-binding protein [Bryobacteraceae bacterium]